MLRLVARKVIEQLRRGVIPVPESAVNMALPRLVKDLPDVERMTVKVGDGHFDVMATIRKMGTMDATLRFEIAGVRISRDEQVIRLRQVGSTKVEGEGLRGRIVSTVVEAMLSSMLGIDPARLAGMPAFKKEGDLYVLDLGSLGLRAKLEQNPKLATLMTYGRIDQIHCVPGRFELVPRLNLAG